MRSIRSLMLNCVFFRCRLSNSSVPTTSQAPATQLIPKFNVRLPQMQASEQTGFGTDDVNHENFQEGPGHPSESLPKCKSHTLDLSTSIAGKSDNPAPQLSAFATARVIGKGARTPFGEMGIPLEPVAPTLWDRKAIANVDQDSPEIIDRKLKFLLNRLTIEKFDSISDRIIALVNKSEKEKDGRTLIQVIRLVFEQATDGENQSEMFARLCRKMMEQISANVQDDGIRNAEGKPIAGGNLFRKYLLNRCQEDFERGWFNKEATAATKVIEEQALKAANTTKGEEEVAL
ncbi:armadillo-type protein [Lentinula edodes]|uniref:Armadillo-type protein n=1 Tax=Lentinula lateritia TaxID=40482 RepID=A0A9W9DUZ2_9AGAR|nr:armadillo-type protein [Lentinula edodes]